MAFDFNRALKRLTNMAERMALQQNVPATKQAYERALEELASDPHDVELRRAALAAGRAHTLLLSKIRHHPYVGRASTDEDRIRNDIDAVVGAGRGSVSIADDLRKLAGLRDDRIITGEEFELMKKGMLRQPSRVTEAIRLLRGLNDLQRAGALTEGEFNQKKWDILSKRLIER